MSNPERKYNDRNEAARLKESLERKGLIRAKRAQAKLAVARSIARGVLDNEPPAELDKPIDEYLASNHLHCFQ